MFGSCGAYCGLANTSICLAENNTRCERDGSCLQLQHSTLELHPKTLPKTPEQSKAKQKRTPATAYRSLTVLGSGLRGDFMAHGVTNVSSVFISILQVEKRRLSKVK